MQSLSLVFAWVCVSVFLGLVVGASLWAGLFDIIQANPLFNGAIVGAWAVSVAWALWDLLALTREAGRLRVKDWGQLILLRPVAELYTRMPHACREVVMHTWQQAKHLRVGDGARYGMGALVFMGLLGTLWGLSRTVLAIADVMASLPDDALDPQALGQIKTALSQPLGAMGSAFSASLLGVGGSVTVGFVLLHVQRTQQKVSGWAYSLLPRIFGLMDQTGSDIAVPVSAQEPWPVEWGKSLQDLRHCVQYLDQRQSHWMHLTGQFVQHTHTLAQMTQAQTRLMQEWGQMQEKTGEMIQGLVQQTGRWHVPETQDAVCRALGHLTVQIQHLTGVLHAAHDADHGKT